MDFVGFPKVARLQREIIITEKIDGTNGQIYITKDGDMYVASRTRWISPADDNHGFAAWARANENELLKLGPGRHFGEWWGKGINRGYGMQEKRFSLFNVVRWFNNPELPYCCDVVPTLYRGKFNPGEIDGCIMTLKSTGSRAAPGYMDPEGIVVFHVPGNVMFKQTIKNDDKPKGSV